MASMKTELVPFSTPNFVLVKMPPRRRQDGFVEGPKYHVGELDAATLSDLCDQFRADIFAKAGKADPLLSRSAETAPGE